MKYKLLPVLACVFSLAILLSACSPSSWSDLEREEIISFTQQALEIEAKRSELMAYFAGLQDKYGQEGAAWIMWRFLFAGVPITALLKDAPSDLEEMVSLQNKLLLLECPQSLQPIKDTLVYIYNSEVQLAESDLKLIRPKDNKDNIGYFQQEFDRFDQQIKQQKQKDPNYYNQQEFRMRDYYSFLLKSPWVKLQLLRRDVYIRWTEILREHGIDPAEEGFTELAGLGEGR